jgi:hypothetical protein
MNNFYAIITAAVITRCHSFAMGDMCDDVLGAANSVKAKSMISWQGFYHSPNSKHLLESFKQKLEDQDVCYCTDVPLVVTSVLVA